MSVGTPESNKLVEVPERRWVVSEVDGAPRGANAALTLQSVEDCRYGGTLGVVWETKPGRRLLPVGPLPELMAGRFDPPQVPAALASAVAVRSAQQRIVVRQAVDPARAPIRPLSAVVVESSRLLQVGQISPAPERDQRGWDGV